MTRTAFAQLGAILYPRERKTPGLQGGDISDLAATSQGSLLLLSVRFQDVD
jgi:hypothetical protein